MKKTFSLISILITLSLIGIILLQVSWIKNMIALREDQVKQKIDGVLNMVGVELSQLKSQFTYVPDPDPFGAFQSGTYHDILRQNTIGSRLTATEINDRIKKAFDSVGLRDLKFEFALIGGLMNPFPLVERQSANYNFAVKDSNSNYHTTLMGIVAQSASPSESLSADEGLVLIAVNWKTLALRSLAWNIALGILFTFVIVAAFYLTVYTMLRQKKLSDIKNDFINNMTHEFKTPIATISLAVDALKNEKVIASKEKMNYFSGIIKEENQRMNKQVETILKASQYERQETDLDMKPLSVHDVIHNVMDNFRLQLHEKNGEADLLLQATNDIIKADDVHFANLVNNLIDNAIKYSKDNVPTHLKITSTNHNQHLVLKFEDNGIGMSKETQRRVFEKFYRAHTGNLHNVKGFGLGLSYVKSVTQSHHGTIKLDSAIGRGSTFTLEFPLYNEN